MKSALILYRTRHHPTLSDPPAIKNRRILHPSVHHFNEFFSCHPSSASLPYLSPAVWAVRTNICISRPVCLISACLWRCSLSYILATSLPLNEENNSDTNFYVPIYLLPIKKNAHTGRLQLNWKEGSQNIRYSSAPTTLIYDHIMIKVGPSAKRSKNTIKGQPSRTMGNDRTMQ